MSSHTATATATLTNAASSAGASAEGTTGLPGTTAAVAAGMAPLPHHPSSSEPIAANRMMQLRGIRLPDGTVSGIARSPDMNNDEFKRLLEDLDKGNKGNRYLDAFGYWRMPAKGNLARHHQKYFEMMYGYDLQERENTVPKNGAAPAGGAGSGERRNRKNSRRNNMMGGKRRRSRRR